MDLNQDNILNKDTLPETESIQEPVVSEADSTEVTSVEPTSQPTEFPENDEPKLADEWDSVADLASVPVTAPKKKCGFIRKLLGCIGLAACFGLIAGGTFFGVKLAFTHFFPQESAQLEKQPGVGDILFSKPNITISSTEVTEVGDMDATETVATVVEQTMPAMVSVQTLKQTTSYFWGQPIYDEQQGGGSGIIVGSNENDLLIATNYHVIEGTTSVQVILADNTSHNVTVKGSDADADLAILALPIADLSQETMDNIDIAVLGDSDSSKIGQMVIAIGNALGYGPTVTVGYLSAKDREVTIQGNDMILLQTNAAINSGNSGGALLNTKGEVIGINNAKLTSTEIEGICFAIPISEATPILDELMTREILTEEEKGYLGVSVTELDSAIFQTYNWPDGVYVSDVTKGSAAEVAGIYKGDIITHVNGDAITTTNQLINAVTSHRHGTEIEITLQRIIEGSFKEFTYSVTLQQHPDLLKSANTPGNPSSNHQKPR